MNWSSLRIGYAPYSINLCAPGDRRRFCFYAKNRHLNFELADPRKIYDIVYLTYGCNIADWLDYKKKYPKVKFVFELIDSYLLEKYTPLTALKGFVRFVTGRESRIFINYKAALKKIIAISGAVVCSTELQAIDLKKLNKNVHISLDYFSDDVIFRKENYAVESKLKLVWEGQPYTVGNIIFLNDVFKRLACPIELYIITDVVASYYNKLYKVKTKSLLKNLKCNYVLIPWDREKISELVAGCDLAIIPIIKNDIFSLNKPENKLLFFWEMGIPVITTDTPAYQRVMDQAGLDYCCATTEDWVRKIERLVGLDRYARKELVEKTNDYINRFHSKEIILKKWDRIFVSLDD